MEKKKAGDTLSLCVHSKLGILSNNMIDFDALEGRKLEHFPLFLQVYVLVLFFTMQLCRTLPMKYVMYRHVAV